MSNNLFKFKTPFSVSILGTKLTPSGNISQIKFTSVTIAKALKELKNDTKIKSYDMWVDDYWGNEEKTLSFFKQWEVDDVIDLQNFDFYDWIKLPKDDREFDLMYFDIDNNGDKLLDLYNNVKHNIQNGAIVLFEGGSLVRDNYGSSGTRMNEVKDEINYQVLTDDVKYSLSIIYDKNKYKLEV